MKKCGIYKIINKITNQVYYGSTKYDFANRWSKHKSLLERNKHHCNYLQNAWNKYGASNFEFIIILECMPVECLIYEQKYLDKYWDNGIKCYNESKNAIAPMLGKKHTQEARDKISKANSGINHPMYGKTNENSPLFGMVRSHEFCNKMSIAMTGDKNPMYGKNVSAKVKLEHSIAMTGNKNPMYGKKHTQATKDKMKMAWQKRRNNTNVL